MDRLESNNIGSVVDVEKNLRLARIMCIQQADVGLGTRVDEDLLELADVVVACGGEVDVVEDGAELASTGNIENKVGGLVSKHDVLQVQVEGLLVLLLGGGKQVVDDFRSQRGQRVVKVGAKADAVLVLVSETSIDMGDDSLVLQLRHRNHECQWELVQDGLEDGRREVDIDAVKNGCHCADIVITDVSAGCGFLELACAGLVMLGQGSRLHILRWLILGRRCGDHKESGESEDAFHRRAVLKMDML